MSNTEFFSLDNNAKALCSDTLKKVLAGTLSKAEGTAIVEKLRNYLATGTATGESTMALANQASVLLAQGDRPRLSTSQTATAYLGALGPSGDFDVAKMLTDATLAGRPLNYTG